MIGCRARHPFRNAGEIARAGLCLGCGVCESVCPTGAVMVELDKRMGTYGPVLQSRLCCECGRCVEVCPGVAVDIEGLSASFLDRQARDGPLGVFRECYVGHAVSEGVRFNSASGGVVSALAAYALEKGVVHGVLVVEMSSENPLETPAFIATTAEEVFSASGSKYCPVTLAQPLRQILAFPEKRYAVVGLPCHLHAIRKLEVADRLHSQIVLHLGLFCANNNTYLGTEYFLRQNGISSADVQGIRYRADGWPGVIRLTLADGREIAIPRGTTERSWSRRALLASAFHYDFAIPRCLLCPDQTAELADISCGDPWMPEYLSSERKGRSLLIVRNQVGIELVSNVREAGIVWLEPLPAQAARRAQNYAYKMGAGARIHLRRMLGLPVPDYGQRELSHTPRQLLLSLRYAPSYVSHRRWLWPGVQLLALAYALVLRLSTKALRLALRIAGVRSTSHLSKRKGTPT